MDRRRWAVSGTSSLSCHLTRQVSQPADRRSADLDLLDRGFDPQGAIDWMNGNGYRTIAAWYPAVQVIGFAYEYMALVNGRWTSC